MKMTIMISETGQPEDEKLFATMDTENLPEPQYEDTFAIREPDGYVSYIDNEFLLSELREEIQRLRENPNYIIDICLEPCDKCHCCLKLDLGDMSKQCYRNVHALYCTNCGAIEEVVEYID